jgi:hypothetical protein
LASYRTANCPRNNRLWTNPIRSRNRTAPSPVTMPTTKAKTDRNGSPIRATAASSAGGRRVGRGRTTAGADIVLSEGFAGIGGYATSWNLNGIRLGGAGGSC